MLVWACEVWCVGMMTGVQHPQYNLQYTWTTYRHKSKPLRGSAKANGLYNSVDLFALGSLGRK